MSQPKSPPPEEVDPQRLDRALVERGLVSTRSKARDLVARGHVTIAGAVERRPARLVRGDDPVTVDEAAAGQVSRGAVKLSAALDRFGFDASGRVALDVGASTGGFTQVLLDRGAACVYAVDVGHGQLDPGLAADRRVVPLESVDARALDRRIVPDPIEAIVADLSFISLTKALPAALALATSGCWLVALVKPQFEAGREAVGKGGIVRDPADRARALGAVRQWLVVDLGWLLLGDMESPLPGGSGNIESLVGAVKP